MKETTKAHNRRWKEVNQQGGFDWTFMFYPHNELVILDIGAGDDPWPNAIPFNIPDGGGDKITDFFSHQWHPDVIHGSQVLEHAHNPVVMLRSWIDMVKPGGHIVATVPDFELYEKYIWPSRFNAGHRSTWSMNIATRPRRGVNGRINFHCFLPDWLSIFASQVEVLRCELIDTNYNRTLGPDVDQTYKFEDGVEAFIEFVLKKKIQ